MRSRSYWLLNVLGCIIQPVGYVNLDLWMDEAVSSLLCSAWGKGYVVVSHITPSRGLQIGHELAKLYSGQHRFENISK